MNEENRELPPQEPTAPTTPPPTPSLEEELKESKEKYLRLLAESENTRKRMQRERQELTKYAVADVIAEFIQPLDSMENALKFAEKASDEVRHWAVGFEMILAQFKEVLHAHGVTAFHSEGTHFDPHMHEAIESTPSATVAPGTVLKEFSKGYRMGDRIIRPARVQVSTALEETKEEKKEEKSHE